MRADALAKREDVLDAARLLISRDGPDVSMRAIAGEAGVGIATLLRHFPTRDDLVLGIVGQNRDRIAVLAQRAATDFPADPEAAWHTFVMGLVDIRISALVAALATPANAAHAVALIAPVRSETLALIAPVVALAQEAGLVARDISVVRLVAGLIAVSRPLPGVQLSGLEEQGEWVVEIYLRGLRPGVG